MVSTDICVFHPLPFVCAPTCSSSYMGEKCDFPSMKIISAASCPQWRRALLQPDHITHTKYYSSGASEAFGEEDALGPYSYRSERRLRISAVQWGQDAGATLELWGCVGAHERIIIRKQELWCQGLVITKKQRMNEYEGTFMNILLSVIFFLKLFFYKLFPFPSTADFLSATLIFHLLFLILSLFFTLCLSNLPLCVLG